MPTLPTLKAVKAVVLVLTGAIVSVLAFPPFGPGLLIIPGIALFLWGLRLVDSRRQGLLLGVLYGLSFFGGLMWWLSVLDTLALILVPTQASFLAAYGWWLGRYHDRPPTTWWFLAVGGWGVMELIRYNFPFGGLEWGAAGYALSDLPATRFPAWVIGTSGLTVLVALIAATAALALARQWRRRLLWVIPIVATVLVAGVPPLISHSDGPVLRVAVVQGSTPCPFEHCPPDERLLTYQQHLALTRAIPAGSADLVVWAEGSTGDVDADPVLNEDVRDAIADEARRIGAWFLVGGDRPLSDTEWVNANVVFNPDGEIVGEYNKQHPVPFGEYIPLRPLFDWIPTLDQVSRDMIRGDGPVVFADVRDFSVGSVISFEGGFSRYGLQHRQTGAGLLVVATNEASYDYTPASDQFIGMTRMRAVELGVPVVHAAVTGKSVIIQPNGDLGPLTGLGTQEILTGEVSGGWGGFYGRTGDLLLYLAALTGILTWWRSRSLVGSVSTSIEEE